MIQHVQNVETRNYRFVWLAKLYDKYLLMDNREDLAADLAGLSYLAAKFGSEKINKENKLQYFCYC